MSNYISDFVASKKAAHTADKQDATFAQADPAAPQVIKLHLKGHLPMV